MSSWFKKTLYSFFALSWITGIAFFILNKWLLVEGEFGLEKHPWQSTILTSHGLSAFILLMIIGAIFINHTPIAWRIHRMRKIGIVLTTITSLQIISAYLLYYVSIESLRSISVYLHLSIGIGLPLILIIHVKLGKRKVPYI
jgi:ABC-type proline/glycine betaine transport system permease subunit